MLKEKGKLIKGLKNKKIVIPIFAILIVVLGMICFLKVSTPTLKLRVVNKEVTANSGNEIVVEAVFSNLPSNIYPAGSSSISFDKNKLEFEEVTLGTMEVYDNYDKSEKEKDFKIPNWTFDVTKANNDGIIRTMYLDSSGEKNSYSKDGFKKKEKDILFKMKFKLKDSANKGDKIEIKIDEAVMATVTGQEDKSTLSTKKGYGDLNIKNVVIKVK